MIILEKFDDSDFIAHDNAKDIKFNEDKKSSFSSDDLKHQNREFGVIERQAYDRGFRDGQDDTIIESNQNYLYSYDKLFSYYERMVENIRVDFSHQMSKIEKDLKLVILSGLFVDNGSVYISYLGRIMKKIQNDFFEKEKILISCSAKTRSAMEAREFFFQESRMSWRLDDTMAFPDCHFSWGVGSFSLCPHRFLQELKEMMDEDRDNKNDNK